MDHLKNFEYITKNCLLLLGATITPAQFGLMVLEKIAQLQKNTDHYDSLV
jgi:hypothetical protein